MTDAPDFGGHWRQHLRIAILRTLNDAPGRLAHESLLVDLLAADAMISADRDQVRAELVWLNEQELVIAEVKNGALGATLTETGGLVAEGRRDHPGVKRPNVTAAVARKALTISLDALKR